MNATTEFLQKISCKSFSSFHQLQENLKEFSNTYGYKFVNAKFSYFPETTPNREKFVYKYLDLRCTYAKKFGCPAFCNVRCRNNYMYIRTWSMEHNHPPDPPDTSTLVDCTESFNRIFNVRLFSSLEDLEARIRELERVTGTRFTKYSSRMLPENSEYRERLVYERVNYACIHAGKTKTRSCNYIGVRSQKIGCQARIRACIAGDKLKVMLFSMKHNHIVSNDYQDQISPLFSNEEIQGPSGLEDADVDYALNLPDFDSTSESFFRGADLPSIPIILKKTSSSQQQKRNNRVRVKRDPSPLYDAGDGGEEDYDYQDQRQQGNFNHFDAESYYNSRSAYRRSYKRPRLADLAPHEVYDGGYYPSDSRENEDHLKDDHDADEENDVEGNMKLESDDSFEDVDDVVKQEESNYLHPSS